jgi:DNA-binding response OmpR family regulator
MQQDNPDSATRILVVEDEFMIAEDMSEALTQAGYNVVGPVGHVAEAVDVARATGLDGAILDVNLHGKSVFPVADTLRARGVPFVFLTGYAAPSLPERFTASPTLRKPVNYTELWSALSLLKPKRPGDIGH